MAGSLESPFIIPVVAMLIPIVAIIGGTATRIAAERSRSEQRQAMLAHNIPLAEIERSLARGGENSSVLRPSDPARTAANIRLTATVLISSGLALAAFFAVLALVLQQREVYSGVAIALLPLGVGLGFLVDYRARRRDLKRLQEEGAF